MRTLIKIGLVLAIAGLLWWTLMQPQAGSELTSVYDKTDLANPLNTPLLDALKSGDMTEIKRQMGTNLNEKVNEVDRDGDTPILVAVYRNLILTSPDGQVDNIVQRLVDAGGYLAARNFEGNTVLHFARTAQMAQYLLSKDIVQDMYRKAIVDNGRGYLQNKRGELPIHFSDTKDLAQVLLFQWPEAMRKDIVNYPDEYGNTPIFFARNPETADFFKDTGALLSITNKNEQTPLMFVLEQPTFEFTRIPGVTLERTQQEVAGQLQADNAVRAQMARYYINNGRGEKIRIYTGDFVDYFAVKGQGGNTALHSLVQTNLSPDVIAELAQQIISASSLGTELLKIKNNNFETPLQIVERRNVASQNSAFNPVVAVFK